ncbi:hypothetical protein N2E09_04485 [Leuconostoc citreum]
MKITGNNNIDLDNFVRKILKIVLNDGQEFIGDYIGHSTAADNDETNELSIDVIVDGYHYEFDESDIASIKVVGTFK